MKRRSLLKALSISPLAMGIWPRISVTQKSPEPVASAKSSSSSQQNFFADFVPGAENKDILQVLQNLTDQKQFGFSSPVIIEGEVASGKTHLLKAVQHKYERLYSFNVKWISGERFMNDVISGIRKGNLTAFRAEQHAHDVYMIDSVNILARGEIVQEEFLHLLKHFQGENKPVFLTVDLPKTNLKTFRTEILSRLDEGLWLIVEPASLESKLKLAHKLSRNQGLNLSQDSLRAIAQESQSVRQLRGKMHQLKMLADLKLGDGSPV